MKGKMPQPPQPTFRLQHLIDYLSLHNHITGELPTEVRVSQEFYDWYMKEITTTAKRLGVPHQNIKELVFDDIKLICKLKLK
jgi:hypothetical protein